MEDAHTKTVDEVIKYFGADPERGLTIDQVNKNQEKYGPNGELSYCTTEYFKDIQTQTIFELLPSRKPEY